MKERVLRKRIGDGELGVRDMCDVCDIDLVTRVWLLHEITTIGTSITNTNTSRMVRCQLFIICL